MVRAPDQRGFNAESLVLPLSVLREIGNQLNHRARLSYLLDKGWETRAFGQWAARLNDWEEHETRFATLDRHGRRFGAGVRFGGVRRWQ